MLLYHPSTDLTNTALCRGTSTPGCGAWYLSSAVPSNKSHTHPTETQFSHKTHNFRDTHTHTHTIKHVFHMCVCLLCTDPITPQLHPIFKYIYLSTLHLAPPLVVTHILIVSFREEAVCSFILMHSCCSLISIILFPSFSTFLSFNTVTCTSTRQYTLPCTIYLQIQLQYCDELKPPSSSTC